MIRCLKCGALATQDAYGIVHMSCKCFPVIYSAVNTVLTVIPGTSEIASQPIGPAAYQPCVPFVASTAGNSEPPNDDLKQEHVDRMNAWMAEHERLCERCSYFFYRGESTRCPTYHNIKTVYDKWEGRIEKL